MRLASQDPHPLRHRRAHLYQVGIPGNPREAGGYDSSARCQLRGGITELKIIAGMAEAYYSPLAPHNPNGPCSLAASLQIAASIPNFLIQKRGDREHELLAKPMPPVKDGYRPLLTEPGLGITIDEDKLMAQVGEPREYGPQFDPDDGSVVDW